MAQIVVVDEQFRVSSLSPYPAGSSKHTKVDFIPEVKQQREVPAKKGDNWTGLIPIKKCVAFGLCDISTMSCLDVKPALIHLHSGTISATRSGILSYHRFSHSNLADETNSEPSTSYSHQTRHVDSPLLTIASPSPNSGAFAYAGKEVDVTVCDIERMFSSSSEKTQLGQKRKKNELGEGEMWRAKNVCPNPVKEC
jgi:hypothetical protein